MRGSWKFYQRGVQLWQRFFFYLMSRLLHRPPIQVLLIYKWGQWSSPLDEGLGGSKYHYKRAIIGPPAKRLLNDVSLACPTLNARLKALWFSGDSDQYCKETLYFCDLGGGGGGGSSPLPPPLWIRVWVAYPIVRGDNIAGHTIPLILPFFCWINWQRKKEGKDQESIQSSPTPRYNCTIRHHKRELRGQPFPSRWPQGINKQRRTKAKQNKTEIT